MALGKKKDPKGGQRNLQSKPKKVRDLVADARRWFLEDDGWDFLNDIDFTTVPEYGGNGRRSGYHPAFCLVAIFLGFQGFHRKEIAGRLKQSYQTVRNWEGKYPEFLDALTCADDLYEVYYIGKMRQTASNRIDGNITAIKFALKNIHNSDWKDKQEFEGRTEVVQDVKDLSPEDIGALTVDRKRALMAALDQEGGEDGQ